MSQTLKYSDLVEALRELGLRKGDIVHVQSDLRRIGVTEAPLTRAALCQFYLDAFIEVVGPTGTITVCTAFEDYGRFGVPFFREKSPSRTDMLSEFIRNQAGAVRSIHPIVSVTGIGLRAGEICGGNHYDGFGYNSPWGRLHRAGAKIVTLGMDHSLGGTTFFHYVERLYGVPYIYTKIFRAPVFDNGVQLEGPFTMSVRYLDFEIVNTPVRVKSRLVETGYACEARTGRAKSWCANARDIVDQMMLMLDEDRWVMLERKPSFREGTIPMDGPTGSDIYDPHRSDGR